MQQILTDELSVQNGALCTPDRRAFASFVMRDRVTTFVTQAPRSATTNSLDRRRYYLTSPSIIAQFLGIWRLAVYLDKKKDNEVECVGWEIP